MAKQRREVWLSLETAQSALIILGSLIAEKLHADDRKQIDSLIENARKAIDGAQSKLTEAVHNAQKAIDGI